MTLLMASAVGAVSIKSDSDEGVIRQAIVEGSEGYEYRDILVTKDDNGVVDETQTVTLKDETQADGECEL